MCRVETQTDFAWKCAQEYCQYFGLMCFLLEITVHTAQTSDSKEVTVGNTLLAV